MHPRCTVEGCGLGRKIAPLHFHPKGPWRRARHEELTGDRDADDADDADNADKICFCSLRPRSAFGSQEAVLYSFRAAL